jgi:NADH:flavin oxidoreductase / NADH oxidase family
MHQREHADRRGPRAHCDGDAAKEFHGKDDGCGGFEPETAELAVRDGDADWVAFGRQFVANPDLPKRIRLGLPLNAYDRDTFYTFDSRGYPTIRSMDSHRNRLLQLCNSKRMPQEVGQLARQRHSFRFGDVYRLCPAGHHKDWNLLDASSDAEPLCGQRFGNPLRPYA